MPESDVWQRGCARRFGAGLGGLLAGRHSRCFYLALALTAVSMAAYWLTYSWMPEYLRSRGFALSTSGAYMAVIVCGEIAGYASFGWVSDRLGRRPAFSIFGVIMASGLLPLTFLWDRFAATPAAILASMALVGIGTGVWSNFGPMLAELFETESRNTAMGAIFNVSRGVQFGAPVLIAALEPRYGLAAGIGLAAGFALLGAAFIWTLPETRGRCLATGAPGAPNPPPLKQQIHATPRA